MKTKIIHVAILVRADGAPGSIEDALNETLRPAYQNADQSGIYDYAINTGGNVPRLPARSTTK